MSDFKKNLPIYLDYHATTPVDERVLEVMLPYFSLHFGNPASRSHRYGWIAESAVEAARKEIADHFQVRNEDIVFTSGATESINLVLRGFADAHFSPGMEYIISAIEHPAVLDTCAMLEQSGVKISVLPVDKEGLVSPEALAKSINSKTALVSIITANNEIGVIQDIDILSAICKERGVPFHTDATQAIGKIPFDLKTIPADFVSFSGHKIYGPKGIGCLVLNTAAQRFPSPLLFGGGHERGLRSGTLNVPGIVGIAKALSLCLTLREEESSRILMLRDFLYSGILKRIPNSSVNGSMEHRLYNNLNVCFKNIHADSLLMRIKDIACSSGSACASLKQKPSSTLTAIGLSKEDALSSVRFGLGRFTTEKEISFVLDRLEEEVLTLRSTT